MTARAARVKAFCERTIEYQNKMNELRAQEAGAIDDAEKSQSDIDKIYEQIHQRKMKYTQLWAKAKNQVYDLVTQSNLSGKEARIIDLRYRKAWTWEQVQIALHYATPSGVDYQKEKAFEHMAPTLDRLFPDWQIGDP